jgi:hypothetical protein
LKFAQDAEYQYDIEMEIFDVKKYGPHMSTPKGWIAEPGEDNYRHRFGGNSWAITSGIDYDIDDVPALLLTLDLQDPRLKSLATPQLDELPICSFINSSFWDEKQVYEIIPQTHTVKLISSDQDNPMDNDNDDRLPLPLIEKQIRLRAMEETDYPSNEDLYWENCDKFVNGKSFIRVLGPPIWLQWVEEETCECGSPMSYVCSIGYENDTDPSGLIPNDYYFRGEGALYFFLCSNCLKIASICQST